MVQLKARIAVNKGTIDKIRNDEMDKFSRNTAFHELIRGSLVVSVLLFALGDAANAQTESDPADDRGSPETEAEKPEHNRRSLPADTFKPSEEISEDFPVPFPVDI